MILLVFKRETFLSFFPQTWPLHKELRINCKAEPLAGIQCLGQGRFRRADAYCHWGLNSGLQLDSLHLLFLTTPRCSRTPRKIQQSFSDAASLWCIWKLCTRASHQMTPIRRNPLGGAKLLPRFLTWLHRECVPVQPTIRQTFSN